MTTLTTGASSGFGAALAQACAARGDRLFLCGRDADRLSAVAVRCRAAGADVDAAVVDVTDGGALDAWLAACEARAPLDLVFANAGVSTGEETEENIRRTFSVNIDGSVNTVLGALRLFRARASGAGRALHIVLTASIAGYGPLKACPAYAASKSFLKTWGLSLRGHLAPEGIRVSVVCPGFVRSRITDRNTCPMPFFMEAESAAAVILRRTARNIGLIAFPWPMRFATWLLSILPFRLNEFFNRFLPEKASAAGGEASGK
jgi:short-subunit dehydrogenase